MDADSVQFELEKEFLESWDFVEKFFAQIIQHYPHWAWLNPIFNLITELRERGYDRHFRAGQSLYYFVLSRSRKHGLREGQPLISIQLTEEGGMLVQYFEAPDVKYEADFERAEVTPELEQLLSRLLSHPID